MDETRTKMREYEPIVTVTVGGYTLNLQDGDFVDISQARIIRVYRNVVDAFAGGKKKIMVFEGRV